MSQGDDQGCTGILWGLVLGVAVWVLGFLVVALILEIGGE